MTLSIAQIEQNVAVVQERIVGAALRAGRDPAAVTLVAVTKTFPPGAVVAAHEAGLRHFGENRVEEAVEKIPAVRERLAADITWHMIGHIQSRKTGDVVPLFSWVHSVDRYKIARRLSEAGAAVGRTLDVLLEVNLSGEETKYGFDLQGWEHDAARLEAFSAEVARIAALPALRLRGLMTMAPYTEQPETVRPVFAGLRALRDALSERLPGVELAHLSMGMSGDFEVAVEEGATLVRIGTAIFGPR